MEEFDLVIIGSGPGGYVCAVRAAQLGLKTAIIEKDNTYGGTCLNVGCIPSKALLESSEHYASALHDFKSHGIELGKVGLNLSTMMERKSKIVKDLTGGIAYLFKKNKVTPFTGLGSIKDSGTVEVKAHDGTLQQIKTKNILIATGSVPNALPGVPYDGKTIISSTEALSLEKVPEHLIVIGAGFIGLEMGSVWLRLGAKVTVIEYGNKICGPMDAQISTKLQQILTKQGMEFKLMQKVSSATVKGAKAEVTIESLETQKSETLSGDIVLVAAGRRAYTEGLGLSNVGIQPDKRGVIQVDHHYRTNVPNIFAIGDVIPGPMLAHKAEEEGVAVAEILAGQAGHVNYETVPGIIYTWPEVASVGLSEEQVKEKGIEYKVGTFPFSPNGRARALGNTDGLVKIIADKATDRIIGAHIIGPRASEMIAELVIGMEFSASSEDIARSFHAHPTLSEVVREAALAVDRRARQM